MYFPLKPQSLKLLRLKPQRSICFIDRYEVTRMKSLMNKDRMDVRTRSLLHPPRTFVFIR
jgi:hypothetical protein